VSNSGSAPPHWRISNFSKNFKYLKFKVFWLYLPGWLYLFFKKGKKELATLPVRRRTFLLNQHLTVT